jgi:hypothetical protein
MNCNICRDNFTAYLDRDVTTAQLADLEGHLGSCDDCRQSLEEFQAALTMLKSLPLVAPPRELPDKVLARIRSELATPQRRPWWQSTGTMAAAAALLVGVVFWGQGHFRNGPSVLSAQPPAVAGEAAREIGSEAQPSSPEPARATVPPAAGTAASPSPTAATSIAGKAPRHVAAAGTEGSRPSRPQAPRTATRVASVASGAAAAGTSDVRDTIAAPSPPPPMARTSKSISPSEGVAIPQAMAFSASDVALAGAAPGAPGASAKSATPMQPTISGGAVVSVAPPSDCEVGRPAWFSIAVTSDIPANDARILVQPGPGLGLAGSTSETVFRGPLVRGRTVRIPVGVIAERQGVGHLRVTLRADVPEISAAVTAATPSFAAAPRGSAPTSPAAASVTLALNEVALRDAFRAVSQQTGVRVICDDGVGRQPITVDFSRGVPLPAALQILADAGKCQVARTADGFRIETHDSSRSR